MRDTERRNRESLEKKLKNKAFCTFFWPDGSLVNGVLTVFTDKQKERGVLWKYVRYKGRRYYLNLENLRSHSFYMQYPPGGRIQAPVLCLHFQVGRPEELRVGALVG